MTENKMRIIHIVNSLRVRAGTELFVSELCSLIKKSHHDVILITLHDNPDKSIESILTKNGIDLICLKKNKKIDFTCSSELRTVVNSFNPDVVNLHEGCLLSYFLAFGFKHKHFKLVKSVHCSCKKDLRGGDKVLQGIYVKKKLLTFICDSNEVKNTVLKHYHNNVRAVTCFAGSSIKKNEQFDYVGLHNKDINFVCVARFYPIKNHISLLKAFLIYLNRHPESKITFVGKGPELEKCKKLVNKSIYKDSIIFAGEQINITPFLKKNDVFVLASKYEGLGISVLEAFASCLPVAVSNVGGLRDLVTDGENGYVFNPKSIESITNCLQRVYDNKNKLSLFAKNNFEKFDLFTIEKSCKDYLDEYSELTR